MSQSPIKPMVVSWQEAQTINTMSLSTPLNIQITSVGMIPLQILHELDNSKYVIREYRTY